MSKKVTPPVTHVATETSGVLGSLSLIFLNEIGSVWKMFEVTEWDSYSRWNYLKGNPWRDSVPYAVRYIGRHASALDTWAVFQHDSCAGSAYVSERTLRLYAVCIRLQHIGCACILQMNVYADSVHVIYSNPLTALRPWICITEDAQARCIRR